MPANLVYDWSGFEKERNCVEDQPLEFPTEAMGLVEDDSAVLRGFSNELGNSM